MADNKIDIVVAASDKASSILRSVADQTNLLSESLHKTDTNAKSLEISMAGVSTAAGILAGAYAGLSAGAFLADFLGASSAEFVAVEKASRRFNDSLKDIAKTVEAGTNIDEKSIFSLMKQARGKGFGDGQLDDVTKAAIGLAEVMETSMFDGLEKVRQAAEGNFTAFESLIPNINQLASADEQLAAVSALATSGLELKKEAANSAISVFDRMDVELHNLYQTVGDIIEPFRQLAFEGIAVTAEMMSQALTPAVEDFKVRFENMGDSVGATSEYITESLVSTFTMAEVVFDNITEMTQGTGAAILLTLEEIRSGWVYAFDFIYEFTSKFIENIVVRLKDMTFAFGLATQDMILYMLDFAAITAATLSGDTERAMAHVGAAAKRGFMEGFEWTDHSELFIAPPVRISEWEKTLQSMIDNMNTNIFEDFDAKFSERMQSLNVGLKENPLEAQVDIKPKGLSGLDMSKTLGLSSEVRMLQAVESRVMVRGSTDDPLLKLSEQQANYLRELLNVASRQADKTNPQFVLEPVN